MDPIRQLLIDLLGLTEQEAADLTLEDAEARLVAAGEEIDLDNATDEDVERLRSLADAANQVRTEAQTQAEAAEARRVAAEEAAALLRGATEEEAPAVETDDEVPAEEAPEGSEGEQAPAPTPEAEAAAPAVPTAPEPVPAPVAEAPAEVVAEVVEPAAPAAAPVPVAAAAPAPPIRRHVTPVARRSPAAHAPRPSELRRGNVTITAASDLPGVVSGANMEFGDIGPALLRRWETLRGSNGVDGNVPVARLNAEFPPERILDFEDHPDVTDAKIEAVCGLKALAASGGSCAPTTPLYDLATVSVADRPVRDGLPGFLANRGGIRFVPPPKISDLAGAVSAWSHANDITPADPTTKPCLTVTCSNITEVFTDAIPVCLRFGNFQARAFPEQVDRFMQLAMAQQARFAERRILTSIGTGSTNVSTGQMLGAAKDFCAEVDRVTAQYRNRHRMGANPLRVILPDWTKSLFRADIARTLNDTVENLGLSDAAIAAWFAVRNINVTFALEGETGQDYGTQAAGGVNPWIKSIVWYVFHEGAWVYLDGGVLDLGLVRDSTLNSTNNFQMWSETFEQVAFRGVESLRVSSALCPDGSIASTKDATALCTSGS